MRLVSRRSLVARFPEALTVGPRTRCQTGNPAFSAAFSRATGCQLSVDEASRSTAKPGCTTEKQLLWQRWFLRLQTYGTSTPARSQCANHKQDARLAHMRIPERSRLGVSNRAQRAPPTSVTIHIAILTCKPTLLSVFA